ncbi:MAG: hypothetical protein A2X71_09950 [Thiobacillus sp. GWE1_62_9]|nr:MAG: hypothetical protein A2X71_09950 [Thiobacillus sp. GWE1_62_9]HBU29490.1 hypothetical protein [Thiobacillus sp.]
MGTPDRSGRRDQRKRGQAQGLVAFAVKLDGERERQVHELAESRQTGLDETVAAVFVRGSAA